MFLLRIYQMIDDLSFLEINQKKIEKALKKALPARDFSNIQVVL